MQFRRLWKLTVFLLAVAITCLAGEAKADDRYRVTLLGDSITSGVVLGGGLDWRSLLSDALSATHVIDNVACGGTSSSDWTLTRGGALCGNQFAGDLIFRDRALPALPSDIVTIALGTNDALGFFEPAPTTPLLYRENLREIVANSLEAGARTVVLMTPPPQCAPSREATLLAWYRAYVAEICRDDPDVYCGPDLFTLLEPDDFIGCDPHPNASGHEKIFEALLAVLLELTPIAPEVELFDAVEWRRIAPVPPVAVIPLVVYSEADFAAPLAIDPATLTFGASGWERSSVSFGPQPACSSVDVDRDQIADLVCAFAYEATGLDRDSTTARLRGRARNGAAIDASVSLALEPRRFSRRLRREAEALR